jgi:hypothetical protein
VRCTGCDYPLWSIQARQCPECGEPFAPSDFEFVPRSVRFCCPHCRQVYYGTDERGLLMPRAFTCVSCDRSVDLDEMVLLPGEDLAEEQTRPGVMPWLERRRRGTIAALLATVGMALVAPGRLIGGVPRSASVGHALAFGLCLLVFTSLVGGLLPMVLWWMWELLVFWLTDMTDAFFFVLLSIGLLLALAGLIPAWGLVTHLVLRITGGARHDIDHTLRALGYSAAASVVAAVPCIGPLVGWVWWMASAVLMVREAQGASSGRAALAVLALPACLVGITIAGTGVLWYRALYGSSWDLDREYETQLVADAIIQYAAGPDGAGLEHASQLLLGGWLEAWDLISFESDTYDDEVPIGGMTLLQFQELATIGAMEQAVADAVAEVPAGIVAHRLGDFVFTCHGVDLEYGDGGLWIVVMIEDPDAFMGTTLDPLYAATGDGSIVEIPRAELAERTEEQNAARLQAGLPPLPDLLTVRHGQPAAAPEPPAGDDRSQDAREPAQQ